MRLGQSIVSVIDDPIYYTRIGYRRSRHGIHDGTKRTGAYRLALLSSTDLALLSSTDKDVRRSYCWYDNDMRMRKGQAPASRFTVTVPADIYKWAEQQRKEQGLNRSEYVTGLYRQRREEQILREREARYREAYAKQPMTQEEREWVDAGGEALARLYENEE